MGTYIVIFIVLAIILFFWYKISNDYVENQVKSLGGMTMIFVNLHYVLLENNFELYSESLRSLEYRQLLNHHSFIKFVLRSSINPKEPYDMQMFIITSGEVKVKTIPYLIVPNRTKEQFGDVFFRMSNELNIKSSSSL